MNFKSVDRGELIAIVGGIVLGASLFLTWYTLGNPNTMLEQCKHPMHFSQGPVGCTGGARWGSSPTCWRSPPSRR